MSGSSWSASANGAKIVVIINKIDLVQNEQELQEVVDYVARNARSLLNLSPEIFPISSRQALQAKLAAREQGVPISGELWEASRFGPLERYILNTLDAGERLRLKFENPLGVAARLLKQYSEQIDLRQEVLKGDFHAGRDRRAAQAYQVEMRRTSSTRAAVDNALRWPSAATALDEMLRIGRIFDPVNGEKVAPSSSARQQPTRASRSTPRQRLDRLMVGGTIASGMT